MIITLHFDVICAQGQEKQVIRSKYEEDVFPNNHKSVWGSYWHNGRWGFKCCHSFV